MNAEIARSLIAGQKIKYWDDRIATVVTVFDAQSEEIVIEFDADAQNPKPRCFLKDVDFMRAEPL